MTPLYQLGDDVAFERCLPDTLKEEGPGSGNLGETRNYSNDVHDRGGKTMDGIIQREDEKWRVMRGLPTCWVQDIARKRCGRSTAMNTGCRIPSNRIVNFAALIGFPSINLNMATICGERFCISEGRGVDSGSSFRVSEELRAGRRAAVSDQ